MDYVLFIVAIIVLIVGLVGDIVPGIPGTIVSYLAMLIVHWTEKASFTTSELVVFGIACAIITVLDYIVPVWGTKKFGGTKAGVRGSTIGLIVGIIGLPMLGITIGPFGLLGVLAGPFFGAYIGEKIGKTPEKQAWRSALGSFIGFVAGTLMKIVYTIVVAVYVIGKMIEVIF